MFLELEKYSPEPATATLQESLSDLTFGVNRVPLEYPMAGYGVVVDFELLASFSGSITSAC